MRKAVNWALAAALVAASVFTGATVVSANTHHSVPATCITLDVHGQPSNGMPWDEPVTFCGQGMPAGSWIARLRRAFSARYPADLPAQLRRRMTRSR
jgi:hypothetical protein